MTDIRGVRLVFESRPQRIVSLVPSLTETIADLEAASFLVGCTTYCEKPKGLRDELENRGGVIGGPKDPDIAAIRALKPELVLANMEENRKEDVESIESFCPVHVSEPRTVTDVEGLIIDLADLLGFENVAREWLAPIEENRRILNALNIQTPLRFVYLVWWNPPMVAAGDTYISSLLEEAPLRNAFSHLKRYPTVDEDALKKTDIDVIFAATEPFSFDDEALHTVKQVAGGVRVLKIDGRMCAWHGTRVLRALSYLGELVDRLMDA